MKFMSIDLEIKKNLLVMSLLFIVLIAYTNSTNLNIVDVLEKVSSGDLNEIDVLEFYKKDYDPSLEYHQIFQPCIKHLIQEQKSKSINMMSKIFSNVKNLFSIDHQEYEIKDLGIKVKCEVYINRFLNPVFKEIKKAEFNPLKSSLESCKNELEIQKMNNLKNDISQNSENLMDLYRFRSNNHDDDHGESKSNEVEFKGKPTIEEINIAKGKSDIKTYVKNSECTAENQKLKVKLERSENDKFALERKLDEKTKSAQVKRDETCKHEEKITKLNLELAEKNKQLSECRHDKSECNSDLEKCKITHGNGGGNAEIEKKLITKIDELSSCEAQRKEKTNKYQECSKELTKLKIELSSHEVSKKEFEKINEECKNDKNLCEKKIKKCSENLSDSDKDKTNLENCKKTIDEKTKLLEFFKTKCSNIASSSENSNDKSLCSKEKDKLNLELIHSHEKQNTCEKSLEEKNKELIRKNSEISSCDVEKLNIKTEKEKSDKTCRDEKEDIKKKLKAAEDASQDSKKKAEECKNKLKLIPSLKLKSHICDNALKSEKKKNLDCQEKNKKDLIKHKSDSEKCIKESKTCKENLKTKENLAEKCTKEKDIVEKKHTELENKLKDSEGKTNDEKSKSILEKDRLKKDLEKNCSSKTEKLESQIKNLEKENSDLKINKDCPHSLITCNNLKNLFEKKFKADEEKLTKIKSDSQKCENDLNSAKKDLAGCRSNENVCKKSLEESKENWKNCESKKPTPCPTTEPALITKYKTQYEKCNAEHNIFKDDLIKCKATVEEKKILIKELEDEKTKDHTSKTNDLQECQKSLLKEKSNSSDKISNKNKEIEELKNKISSVEKKTNLL